MKSNSKRLLIPGLALGIIILILSIALKPAPPQVEGYSKAKLVNVTQIETKQIAPEILGFGRVAPKHIWQGVAQVSGRLVYRHPQLETGRILKKGTLLLEIDPLEYQLGLAQAQANLNATRAKLTQLDQQEKNYKTSLNIEEQKLVLVKQEYQRKLKLKKRNLVSSSELESQKQAQLAQKKLVEDLQNALKLLPDDRAVTQAQFNVDEAKLADAERRLAQTQVTLPFDAKLGEVNVEQDQVVNTGAVMLVAHQLGKVEVKAELSLTDMRVLAQSIDASQVPQGIPSIEKLNLDAKVTLHTGSLAFNWPAEVTRVAETVNPDQATVGVYLEVEQDFLSLNPAKKPPLTNGMFVATAIIGQSNLHQVIPEVALHGEHIYLMDKDKRLKIQKVKVLFRRNNQVAIQAPIEQGDQLVLNDLIPAVKGMLLEAQQANDTATGKALGAKS